MNSRVILYICCLFLVPAYGAVLDGKKTVYLIDSNGNAHAIADISFATQAQTTTYTLTMHTEKFQDYFLSMKEMKCLEGPELWCHLRYPYEQPRTVTTSDLRWLSHDLLFMFKKAGEYGANFWNGIYYELNITKGIIYGHAQAVDLNALAAPPDNLLIPPFEELDRTDIESDDRWLPVIEIK